MEACSASSSWLPAPTLKKRSSSGQRKRARCRPISDAATERRPRDRARDRAAAALSLALSLSVSLALAVSLSLSVSVSLSLSLCQTLCLAASRWCVRCVRAAAGGTGRAPSPTFADTYRSTCVTQSTGGGSTASRNLHTATKFWERDKDKVAGQAHASPPLPAALRRPTRSTHATTELRSTIHSCTQRASPPAGL